MDAYKKEFNESIRDLLRLNANYSLPKKGGLFTNEKVLKVLNNIEELCCFRYPDNEERFQSVVAILEMRHDEVITSISYIDRLLNLMFEV